MSRSRAIVRFLATAAVVMVGTAVVGRAAGLADSSHDIGAGTVPTPRCTSAALTVVETVTTTYVTGVTVSSIPSSCAGATISVTMAEGPTVFYTPASQTVPAGGGQVTVAIPSGDIPVTAAAEADVVMTGP
ncbi:MAG: hypothetical protein ABSC16_11785 [Candidatus Dormibacteria bacterium]|jgi:hypothetical protein|nr:hypothetical protein [Chloroflexota bacterium]HBV94199.1 hypothetical protein [Chloroflexota bacterium]